MLQKSLNFEELTIICIHIASKKMAHKNFFSWKKYFESFSVKNYVCNFFYMVNFYIILFSVYWAPGCIQTFVLEEFPDSTEVHLQDQQNHINSKTAYKRHRELPKGRFKFFGFIYLASPKCDTVFVCVFIVRHVCHVVFERFPFLWLRKFHVLVGVLFFSHSSLFVRCNSSPALFEAIIGYLLVFLHFDGEYC